MGEVEAPRVSGYFKVPLLAAREIVATTDGPEALAGYMVLREGAYGDGRSLTACGARSIAKYTGCTDWRSKQVMGDLRSLCFGDCGELRLIHDSRTNLGNAPIYALGDWPEPDAYLPALLVKSKNDMHAPLHRICRGDDDPELKRDALLLLLNLYATTDYAGWMGAPPDRFVYQRWDTDGVSDDGFQLGCCAEVGGLGLWMVAPPADNAWKLPDRLHGDLFTQGAAADKSRVWRAFDFLLRSGTVCKVAVVSDGAHNYPLWVFSPPYREALAKWHGLSADLAEHMHRLASYAGADLDGRIFLAATDPDRQSDGTGIYFCLAKSQLVVRTLLVPRLHAPTPMNLDGLKEAARIVADWTSRIQRLGTKGRAA